MTSQQEFGLYGGVLSASEDTTFQDGSVSYAGYVSNPAESLDPNTFFREYRNGQWTPLYLFLNSKFLIKFLILAFSKFLQLVIFIELS